MKIYSNIFWSCLTLKKAPSLTCAVNGTTRNGTSRATLGRKKNSYFLCAVSKYGTSRLTVISSSTIYGTYSLVFVASYKIFWLQIHNTFYIFSNPIGRIKQYVGIYFFFGCTSVFLCYSDTKKMIVTPRDNCVFSCQFSHPQSSEFYRYKVGMYLKSNSFAFVRRIPGRLRGMTSYNFVFRGTN